MNNGDNHEDETASMHLVFLLIDTLTLPFQGYYVHLTPMTMLQVFPPSTPVDKGIYPSETAVRQAQQIWPYLYVHVP